MSQGQGDDRSAGLVGRSYTRARRHPWVIGKIQGWTIPLGPFTATQLGVLAGGLWLLVQTFTVWSRFGPLAVVVIALPFAATWAVRHAQIEGRAPLRALAGYLALWTAPSAGVLRGRPAFEPHTSTFTGLVTISSPPHKRPHPTPVDNSPWVKPAPATPTNRPLPARLPGATRPRPTALQALLADLDAPTKED